MILGIGTDLVEVSRIDQKVKDRPGFMERVFSAGEISYCQRQAHPAENFAARFAAKEAFLKALGTGMEATYDLHLIEVANHSNGQPYLRLADELHQLVLKKTDSKPFFIHLSLSHTKNMASAYIVIEVS